MIAEGFDSRTRAHMGMALEKVCGGRPGGDLHDRRKPVAEGILRCARSGTEAGERALARRWDDRQSA
jgi:hypothetical protein